MAECGKKSFFIDPMIRFINLNNLFDLMRFHLLLMLLILILSSSSSALAAEYQRPPFILSGTISVPESDRSGQGFTWRQSDFEAAWYHLQIKVNQNSFTGYSRYVNSKNSNHVSLLTVTGTYDRGYLVGTWDYQEIIGIIDRGDGVDLGPYRKTWEASGSFVSGLIERDQPVKANVRGSADLSYSDFGPDNTPEKPIWVKAEFSKEIAYVWDGKIQGYVCGDSEYLGQKIDSGAIIDSVSGRVEILRCGLDMEAADKEDWERAVPGTKLYVEDHIRTSQNVYSRALVRLGDGNVVTLKENTEIVIKKPPEGKTKWQLLIGKLWKNSKEIWEHGSFYIETSQAVAGIKGTEFEISFDGKQTEVRVAEGLVSLTSNFSGNSIDIGAGQSARADYNDISELTPIDARTLKEVWQAVTEEARNGQPIEEEEDLTPRKAPEGAPINNLKVGGSLGKGTMIAMVIILALILTVGLFSIKKGKRR